VSSRTLEDVTPIDRLRAILGAAFEPMREGETPEARLVVGEAEMLRELAALSGCGAAEVAELFALSGEVRERAKALPADVHARHSEWLRVHHRMYKAVFGPNGELRMPDIPAGVLCVPLELIQRFIRRIVELEYELHRREHPSACDCAALTELSIHRKPTSPALVSTGATTDGYHDGEGFTCESCGAQWFHGIGDGSVAWTFWERVDPTARPRRP
jgi:hypothetical protein